MILAPTCRGIIAAATGVGTLTWYRPGVLNIGEGVEVKYRAASCEAVADMVIITVGVRAMVAEEMAAEV